MNYRSFDDLYRTIIKGSENLPIDIDLVVGIPRSGLLAANILALYKNLPITDLEGLAEKRLIAHGNRLKKFGQISFSSIKKILILDDSSSTGRAIEKAKEFIDKNDLHGKYEILYAVVFATDKSYTSFDFHFDLCSTPRVFDWNIFHHDSLLKNCCVDIDGVLCRDPTEDENDDGDNYRYFLLNVAPKFVPKETIGFLVTNRLERYRNETETWLEKNNIKYNSLHMSQHKSKAERIAAADYHLYKARVYETTKATLFIESSLKQAKGISDVTGRKVYCTDELTMITPSSTSFSVKKINYKFDKLLIVIGFRFIKVWVRSMYNFFKGR